MMELCIAVQMPVTHLDCGLLFLFLSFSERLCKIEIEKKLWSMPSSVTARGVFSVEPCPSEGQTMRGYQALWSRNDGREPPRYMSADMLTKVSPPSQDEVGNKWWKLLPDGGCAGCKDSGTSWNLSVGESRTGHEWMWLVRVPDQGGCSRWPLEELSSRTRPRGRAGPSIVLNELCPEKTKGRGSQWGEMVPDEPRGSLSSILWLWDQPQGSQGLSQQKWAWRLRCPLTDEWSTECTTWLHSQGQFL